MTKPIFLGLILTALIVPQFTKGQTPASLANSTSKANTPAGAVSAESRDFSNNTSWTSQARDFNGLKCELAVEINKAKLELCLSNQQAIDAMREDADKKRRDLVAQVESAAQRRFYELKDVMDVEISDNKNVLTWFGILSTIVGALAAIFGVFIPFLNEKERKNDYAELKNSWQSQKKSYDDMLSVLQGQIKTQAEQFEKLREDMVRQTKINQGVTAAMSSERYLHEFMDKQKVSSATSAIYTSMFAIAMFTSCGSGARLCAAIDFLYKIDKEFLSRAKKDEIQKAVVALKYRWEVAPNEVKKVLNNVKAEDRSKNADSKTFENLYRDYGLPKV